MVFQTSDHHAIDERRCRGIFYFELDAPGLTHDPQIEVFVLFENHSSVVDIAAGIEHGQSAFSKQGIQAALTRIQEFGYLLL